MLEVSNKRFYFRIQYLPPNLEKAIHIMWYKISQVTQGKRHAGRLGFEHAPYCLTVERTTITLTVPSFIRILQVNLTKDSYISVKFTRTLLYHLIETFSKFYWKFPIIMTEIQVNKLQRNMNWSPSLWMIVKRSVSNGRTDSSQNTTGDFSNPSISNDTKKKERINIRSANLLSRTNELMLGFMIFGACKSSYKAVTAKIIITRLVSHLHGELTSLWHFVLFSKLIFWTLSFVCLFRK